MTLIPIVCTNCGAKYRLPETFKSDKAKCKKCGTLIDVAAQRDAATEPAPEPASASSESARPSRARRSERASTSRTSGSRARRSSRRDAGGAARRSRRGSSEEGETKKGKGMMIGLGIGAVAIIVVGLVVITGGSVPDEEQTAEGLTDVDPLAQQASEDEVARLAEEQAQREEEAAAAAAEAAAAEAAAAEAAATEQEAAATEAAAGEPPVPPEKVWLTYTINSVEELFDPKTETEPVAWPEYVTEEERAEVLRLIDDIEGGGLPAVKAKTRLEALGHKSLAGIINRLREIDYTDSFDTFFAYELNKLIERMTITINAGFENVELGGAIDLRIAHWNALTVKAWIRFLEARPTKEDWDKFLASRNRPDR